MNRILVVLLLAASAFLNAHAEVLPTGGYRDGRVKNVAYDENDVVKVVGRYGYSTVIEFAAGETVTDVALGDALAWEVAPSRNNMFVKPREDNASTNMTVVTDKHIYHFMLEAKPHKNAAPKEAFFAVRFSYPADEASKRAAAMEAQRAKAALAQAPKPSNWSYWACGDRQLRPTEVYDDGRFTYMRFPGAQEIPAVFITNSDNTESLANGQMRGDQFVVYATAKKFLLRKGKSVACVQNRNFNWYGVATPNGTTSPQVQRTLEADPPPPPARTVPSTPPDIDASPLPMPAMPAAPGAESAPGRAQVPTAALDLGAASEGDAGPSEATFSAVAMTAVLHAKQLKE